MNHNVFLNYFPEQHNTDIKMSPGPNLDNFIKKHIPAGWLLYQMPSNRIAYSGGECTVLLARLSAWPMPKFHPSRDMCLSFLIFKTGTMVLAWLPFGSSKREKLVASTTAIRVFFLLAGIWRDSSIILCDTWEVHHAISHSERTHLNCPW